MRTLKVRHLAMILFAVFFLGLALGGGVIAFVNTPGQFVFSALCVLFFLPVFYVSGMFYESEMTFFISHDPHCPTCGKAGLPIPRELLEVAERRSTTWTCYKGHTYSMNRWGLVYLVKLEQQEA